MIEICCNAKTKELIPSLDFYEAIIQADQKGQLWPAEGYFFPDCSATKRSHLGVRDQFEI